MIFVLSKWAQAAGWQHPEYVIASPIGGGGVLDQNGNPTSSVGGGSTPGMRPAGSSKKKVNVASSKPKSGANVRATVFQPAGSGVKQGQNQPMVQTTVTPVGEPVVTPVVAQQAIQAQ